MRESCLKNKKMIIKTKRLILRSWKKGDEKELIENISNPNVSKFLSEVPCPYKMKDAKEWLKISKEKNVFAFAIILESEKQIVGGIGLHDTNKFKGISELGYWLGEKYHRQGIMSEASRAVLDFAFKKLKLRRVYAYAYIKNEASNSLLKKLGFKYEGMMRKHARAKSTGKIHDCNVYGLLKEEWK